MRRLLVLVLVLLLAISTSACGMSRVPGRIAGSVTASVGGTMILTGLTADTRRSNFGDSLGAAMAAEMGIGAGIAIALVGIGVLVGNELRTPAADEPEPSPPPIAREPRFIPNGDRVPDPPTMDGRLHQLTLQASFAARAGQCTAVRVIADRVAELDAHYRDAGFTVDGAIRGCL